MLRNEGTQTITVSTDQPLLASLVDRDGDVAGVYTGAIAGTGLGLPLHPGEEHRIHFYGGTASYGSHYATPPGGYDVVVVLPLRTPESPGQLVTPPVGMRVME